MQKFSWYRLAALKPIRTVAAIAVLIALALLPQGCNTTPGLPGKVLD